MRVVDQSPYEVPPSSGTVWLDDKNDTWYSVRSKSVEINGHNYEIASHMVRFPADLQGMTSAEMVLYLRRDMMKKENEGVLLAFAEVGNDLAAIFRLYKEILP
jgi:hypothetical protein